MELRLDLHFHSERSVDGCMSLREIVALARERGLNGVAICDHDRVLDEVPEFDDFLVIPATEVSTERGHLLGLFVREPIETRKFSASVTAIHAQWGGRAGRGGFPLRSPPFSPRAGWRSSRIPLSTAQTRTGSTM